MVPREGAGLRGATELRGDGVGQEVTSMAGGDRAEPPWWEWDCVGGGDIVGDAVPERHGSGDSGGDTEPEQCGQRDLGMWGHWGLFQRGDTGGR